MNQFQVVLQHLCGQPRRVAGSRQLKDFDIPPDDPAADGR
jgi:hypothetical protein